MADFISAKEAAKKWNISQRRVAVLCSENRIAGALMVGNMWIIPSEAQKPEDMRLNKKEHQHYFKAKPFVKWAGGKSQLVATLETYIAKDTHKIFTKYAEPMVGGGALLFDVIGKFYFNEYCICDKNKELINVYNLVKTDVENLIDRLSSIQNLYIPLNENERKNYYYSSRNKYNSIELTYKNSLEKAALFIFLNKTCFNGLYRVNRKGQFNVPIGKYKHPLICDKNNLRAASKALKNVQIIYGDFEQAETFIDNKTFVYFDPPYRPISETSCFNNYGTESFDDKEQLRLAEFIDKISEKGAKILLSNSDPKNLNPNDEFFDELYSKYSITRVEATRMINSNRNKRGKINELLIHN